MQNWHRWAMTIGLAFFGGVITAASDHDAKLMDYLRHGLISAGPAVAALNVTLTREVKIE